MVATDLDPLTRTESSISSRAHSAQFLWLWLFVASIAAGVCALNWPSAHLDPNPAVGIEAEYLPVGIDSYYHARRILDTVASPGSFYQFDPKIHAPEGSMLPWPWGYDYAMAWVVKTVAAFGVRASPVLILLWIPVAAVFVSVGLVMLLARQLSLSIWSVTLAGLSVALSPLTQLMHGVGAIDHHFAEYIMVLAAVTFALRWLTLAESYSRAITLGVLLGVAPAIHNGLFVLQLPFLATIAVLWAQGMNLPRRAVARFAVALIATTIAILIPSLAFRLGKFEFYTLSWFHLYVAAGTSLVAYMLSVLDRSRRSIGILALSAVAMLVPLIAQLTLAESFLSGNIARLDVIAEMRSPLRLARKSGFWGVSEPYSLLLWLLPLTACYCVYQGWRDRLSGRLIFWISALFGIAMLLMQFRLHYFGSFALVLPLLILAEHVARMWPDRRKQVMLFASLLFIFAYWPPLGYVLGGHNSPAGDQNFVALRPILGSLQRACARDPGIVLADNDAGHYIRYYTECSVIANNFLLTRQHEEKIHEIDYLTSLRAADLPRISPDVKYVLLRPVTIFREENGGARYMTYTPKSAQLFGDLMLKEVKDAPANYTLIDQANIGLTGEKPIPYIRLYRVGPVAN